MILQIFSQALATIHHGKNFGLRMHINTKRNVTPLLEKVEVMRKGMTMAMDVIMEKVKMRRMMIFTPEAIPIAT